MERPGRRSNLDLLVREGGLQGQSIADVECDAPGTHEVDLGNGLGIRPNTPLSMPVNGGGVTIHSYGDTVPAAAIR